MMKKVIKIDPLESKLALTDVALENLINEGSQVSTIDFDGYVWPAPVVKDKKHQWILSLNTNDHCLYITAVNPKCKPLVEKDKWDLVYKLFKENVIEDVTDHPFMDYHSQLGVELDPSKTEIIEEKFFPYDPSEEGDSIMPLVNPTIKTKKIMREALIGCPYCNKINSFNTEDFIDALNEHGGNGVDLICSWCGEKFEVTADQMDQIKIIYKEDKEEMPIDE